MAEDDGTVLHVDVVVADLDVFGCAGVVVVVVLAVFVFFVLPTDAELFEAQLLTGVLFCLRRVATDEVLDNVALPCGGGVVVDAVTVCETAISRAPLDGGFCGSAATAATTPPPSTTSS